MSALTEFLILFKSNAKQTQKDIKDVQDETKKGQDKINDADKAAQQLANSLLKVGLEGIAAFTSFEGIKQGIQDAVTFNAALEKTAQLTGANSSELAAYDATFAQFGANSGDFINWFKEASKQVQLVKGDVNAIIPNIRELGKEIVALESKGDIKGAEQLFRVRAAQYGGLPDSFFLALNKDPAAFDAELARQEKLLETTDDINKSALQLESSWKELSTQTIAAFTPLFPIFEFLLNVSKEIVKSFHMFFDLITFNSKDFDKILKGDSPFNAAPTVSGTAAQNGSARVPLGIRNNNPGNLRSAPGALSSGGFAQFSTLSQGLSAEDRQLDLYGQRGINTLAGVASRWAPSSENDTAAYIAGLVKSTGFSANQQLDLSDPAVRQKIANAINAQENGASYGNLFAYAQNSVNAADNTPLSSGGATGTWQTNVTVGTVVVNTQATDANGIAGDIQKSLNEHLSYLAANANDGIAK